MVFIGCSFTWGQGLYHYNKEFENLPTEEKFCYFGHKVTDAHILYKNTLYYPRLVANHFKTFEVTKASNGGSEGESLDFLKYIFRKVKRENYMDHFSPYYMNYSEVSHVFLQTSVPGRTLYYFEHDGKSYAMRKGEGPKEHCQVMQFDLRTNGHDIKVDNNIFFDYILEKNLTFEQWYSQHLETILGKIKNEFLLLEENGVKTKILCWHDDYLELIYKDEFLNERFIRLDYENKTYESINQLIVQNKNMAICDDYEFFGDKTPEDHHPSKLCHQVIAQSIIKEIDA